MVGSSTTAPSANAFKESKFTGAYSIAKRALLNPRFGSRRINGICPPSKPILIELPDRADCPLPPRPEVLPWPLDSPAPKRFLRCLAPGRGLMECSLISGQEDWWAEFRTSMPRDRRISSRWRSCMSASSVALATLAGFFDPNDLERTSRTPTDSTTARTVLPQIKPVPGLAGLRRTRAPSYSAKTS